MNVSVGQRWEAFIEQIVNEGRYASVSEVVREGLRLVEEREQKLKALREHVQAAVAEGGRYSAEDVLSDVEAHLTRWEKTQKAAS